MSMLHLHYFLRTCFKHKAEYCVQHFSFSFFWGFQKLENPTAINFVKTTFLTQLTILYTFASMQTDLKIPQIILWSRTLKLWLHYLTCWRLTPTSDLSITSTFRGKYHSRISLPELLFSQYTIGEFMTTMATKPKCSVTGIQIWQLVLLYLQAMFHAQWMPLWGPSSSFT